LQQWFQEQVLILGLTNRLQYQTGNHAQLLFQFKITLEQYPTVIHAKLQYKLQVTTVQRQTVNHAKQLFFYQPKRHVQLSFFIRLKR